MKRFPTTPGQYHDAKTGKHYNYYRDYDPSIGRYLKSDPIGLQGGLNTYAYVGGRPLTLVDRKGLAWSNWCIADPGNASCYDPDRPPPPWPDWMPKPVPNGLEPFFESCFWKCFKKRVATCGITTGNKAASAICQVGVGLICKSTCNPPCADPINLGDLAAP